MIVVLLEAQFLCKSKCKKIFQIDEEGLHYFDFIEPESIRKTEIKFKKVPIIDGIPSRIALSLLK
jgi:ferredoxin